jgi:hypothetical protein
MPQIRAAEAGGCVDRFFLSNCIRAYRGCVLAATRAPRPACGRPIHGAILGVALALEHEAIAANQIGAESGLLQSAVLDVAVAFQSHYKAHRDALAATIAKLGGRPWL